MRVVFVLLVIAGLTNEALAQNAEAMKRQRFIFENATTFNDPVVARTALYNMMAMNPQTMICWTHWLCFISNTVNTPLPL